MLESHEQNTPNFPCDGPFSGVDVFVQFQQAGTNAALELEYLSETGPILVSFRNFRVWLIVIFSALKYGDEHDENSHGTASGRRHWDQFPSRFHT